MYMIIYFLLESNPIVCGDNDKNIRNIIFENKLQFIE